MTELQEIDLKNEPKQSLRGKPIICKNCKEKITFHSPEEKLVWQKSRLPCPHCDTLYAPLPRTERSLMILQDRFFEGNYPSMYLSKIYEVLCSYAQSLIKKKFRKYVRDEMEDCAHKASAYVIEEYCKPRKNGRPFRIKKSFASYLELKIKQAIWGKEEHDFDDLSINFTYENNRSFDIGDEREETDFTIDQIDNEEKLNALKFILTYPEKYSNSPGEDFSRVLSLYQYLKYGTTNSDMFFRHYHRKGKYLFLQTLRILKKELFDGIRIKD